MSVLLGHGGARFGSPAPYVVGPALGSLFVEDVNGDGALDLVATSSLVSPVETAVAGPTATSLTLNPFTVPGGSGGTSTATVTLSAPAPAGGTNVTLSSSNTDLAASRPALNIPEGSSSATFTVGTNARYRRYSALAFTATITATANGSSQSATLAVTAQPRPADINGDSVQRHGPVCGSVFPARGGDAGILYECFDGPDFGTVGKCTFRQECQSFGCQSRQADGFTFRDICATSAPFPISLSPSYVVGGNSSQATAFLNAPAPAGGADVYFFSSNYQLANVPVVRTVPAGGTTATDTVTTSAVTSPAFAAIWVNAENPQPSGHVGTRAALRWLAVVPSGTCSPTSCASEGKDCGTISDGCGGTLDCGTCTSPETCGGDGTPNVCGVCTPTTCAAQGANCGMIADGCGGTLVCGSCTAPETCGGAGIPNVCGGSAPTDTGLRSPTAHAANSGGDGNGFEVSPANAQADDSLSAVDNNSGSGSSTSCTSFSKDKHRFYSYGFTFPAGASIRGIEVRLDAKADSTSGSPKMCVQLSWDGGTTWTSTKSTPTLGTSMGTFMLGSVTDTWGRSWTTGNLTNASFRLRVINVSSSSSRDFSLDWVAVRVHFQ